MSSLKINLDFSLFETKTFYYEDCLDKAPEKIGIYFWYLMPSIPKYINNLKSLFDILDEIPQKVYRYGLKSEKGQYFKGLISSYKANFNIRLSNKDEDTKISKDFLSDIYFFNLLRNSLSDIFLEFPPIRIGIANPDTLKNRLTNYSSISKIQNIIDRINQPSVFNKNTCVIKTLTIKDKYRNDLGEDMISQYIYMYEFFYLNYNLPIGNEKRGN